MINIKNIVDNLKIYEMVNKVLLFNPETVQWTDLSYEEYTLYKGYLDEQKNIDEKKAEKIILKLLVDGIITFENKQLNILNFSDEYLKVPMAVYYEPTAYCNLKCVYCYAEACNTEKIEYDTYRSKKLLSKILKYPNLQSIVFTGGEPLLRKDCLKLARYIYEESGIRPCILTNGLLINEKNIEQFKLFEKVTISLDGHKAEIHERTRGINTFSKVVEAIRLLRKNKIDVTVTTVISKVNQAYVKEIMDFVKNDLGVENHNMSTHISFGRGTTTDIECSEEEIKQYRDTYFDYMCKEKSSRVETLLRPNIKRGECRYTCGAGCGEMFINDEGEVYPCRLLNMKEYYLGNLNDTSIYDIVESKRLRTIKEEFNVNNIEDCVSCSYKNICGGGCRSVHAAYTGDYRKSSDLLCNMLKNEIDSAIMIQGGYNPISRKEIKKNGIG